MLHRGSCTNSKGKLELDASVDGQNQKQDMEHEGTVAYDEYVRDKEKWDELDAHTVKNWDMVVAYDYPMGIYLTMFVKRFSKVMVGAILVEALRLQIGLIRYAQGLFPVLDCACA